LSPAGDAYDDALAGTDNVKRGKSPSN